jgi:hypothetical protein
MLTLLKRRSLAVSARGDTSPNTVIAAVAWARIVRTGGERSVSMRRTLEERELVRSSRQDLQTPAVSRIDREALEGVMREDVFLAADDRALGLDVVHERPRGRSSGRRA